MAATIMGFWRPRFNKAQRNRTKQRLRAMAGSHTRRWTSSPTGLTISQPYAAWMADNGHVVMLCKEAIGVY